MSVGPIRLFQTHQRKRSIWETYRLVRSGSLAFTIQKILVINPISHADQCRFIQATATHSIMVQGTKSIAMPLWWWYSLYGMFAFILLAILGRLFERPKSRYTRLLQELDQSLKARELADRKVINIRQQIDSIPPEAINAAESEYNKWPIWLIPKSRRGMVDTAEGPKTAPAEPPTVSGVDTAPTAPEKAPIRA